MRSARREEIPADMFDIPAFKTWISDERTVNIWVCMIHTWYCFRLFPIFMLWVECVWRVYWNVVWKKIASWKRCIYMCVVSGNLRCASNGISGILFVQQNPCYVPYLRLPSRWLLRGFMWTICAIRWYLPTCREDIPVRRLMGWNVVNSSFYPNRPYCVFWITWEMCIKGRLALWTLPSLSIMQLSSIIS